MKRVIILGASSAIARAVARQLATEGAALALVARDANRMADDAADLRVRGAREVLTETRDLTDFTDAEAMLDRLIANLGGLDLVLIAHGTLPDQAECQRDMKAFRHQFEVNALSVMEWSERLAARLEAQNRGILAVISSVAGDRGRKSNYAYGAAKAAVTTHLAGLRNRFGKSGVQVLTIKPGFVDTPMTAHLPKGGPLWATVEQVASDILRAVHKGRDVVYTRWFWRYIMLIIRHIPERIFKRLSL